MKSYRQFVEHVQTGKQAEAFSMLSAESRKQLEQRHQALKAAAGERIDEDVAALTFSKGFGTAAPVDIRLVEETATKATVAVSVGGEFKNQQLVLEEGQWKLDWTSLFPQ